MGPQKLTPGNANQLRLSSLADMSVPGCKAHQFNCWIFWLRLVWSQRHHWYQHLWSVHVGSNVSDAQCCLLKYSRFTVQMVWSQTRERPSANGSSLDIPHLKTNPNHSAGCIPHLHPIHIPFHILMDTPYVSICIFFWNREPMIYIYIRGCWSKLGTPIVGWLLLKIDLYLWSPRSLILTHSHICIYAYVWLMW